MRSNMRRGGYRGIGLVAGIILFVFYLVVRLRGDAPAATAQPLRAATG